MKLLCGIIIGDVKTGEGTRTALQLTCCMGNEGARICCSKVYLYVAHDEEVRHNITYHKDVCTVRGLTSMGRCPCCTGKAARRRWWEPESALVGWEAFCRKRNISGLEVGEHEEVNIKWMLFLKYTVSSSPAILTLTPGVLSTMSVSQGSYRSCPSWLNWLSGCLWFASCWGLVLVWENIMGLL